MPTKSSSDKKPRRPVASRIEVRRFRRAREGRVCDARRSARERGLSNTPGSICRGKRRWICPPATPDDPYHTFLFSLENGDVIDAAIGGNESRWINHSCDPNCETFEEDDRIFVYALRSLKPGDELLYDYKIVPAERRTKKLEKEFACHCGSAKCRGTMLEPR